MHGFAHFLFASSLLWAGLFAVVTRKNAIMILMGIELILTRQHNYSFADKRLGLDGRYRFCYNPCSS
jgi:multisubunit Na+/H+ antiporter MnhC subunit